MTTKEDIKELLKEYEKIEILENALLCERQLNTELQDRNEHLQKQIEKMKCCMNCKHISGEYEKDICSDCRNNISDNWELED